MLQLIVKGQPSHVRHLAHNPEYLFVIEFHYCTKKTTYTNKEERPVKVTALVHLKQWNQLLQMISGEGDTLANINKIIMEGKMDHIPEKVYGPSFLPY